MLAIVSPKVSIVNIIHFPFLHKVITISATSNPAVIKPMKSLLVLFIVIFNQRVCSCSQNESSDHNCQHHFLFPFVNYCVMFCLNLYPWMKIVPKSFSSKERFDKLGHQCHCDIKHVQFLSVGCCGGIAFFLYPYTQDILMYGSRSSTFFYIIFNQPPAFYTPAISKICHLALFSTHIYASLQNIWESNFLVFELSAHETFFVLRATVSKNIYDRWREIWGNKQKNNQNPQLSWWFWLLSFLRDNQKSSMDLME